MLSLELLCLVQHQLAVTYDSVQGRAQLVAHPGQKLRFRTIGCLCDLLGDNQFALRLPELSDVLNDAVHAHDCAILVYVRVEAGKVSLQLIRMRRCRRFDFLRRERYPGIDNLVDVRRNTGRSVSKHFLECFPQVFFHRNCVQSGKPLVDIAITQLRVEIA